MSIPFIDLKAQYRAIKDQVDAGIARVLEHGSYVMGPEISALEDRLAGYVGRKYAVGCASGTDALLMALMALGIGPGDAVFTSPFTFIATAEVVALLGATPVFADVDPVTYNIDPGALARAIEATKSKRPELTPKAIIPVDIFGQPADYDAILPLAQGEGLAVIEDAAQSFGGARGGVRCGAFGEMACTSFFPAKPLGCYGDGGMVFTDDEALRELLLSVRVHGQSTDKYDNVRLGITGRLDTIQAAVLLAKMDVFDAELDARQQAAGRYAELLADIPGLAPPAVAQGNLSAWAQYSPVAESAELREMFQVRLANAGVPSARYYPIPLHLQTVFAHLGHARGDFPVSEDLGDRIFSLPMHPYLDAETQARVAEALRG